MHVIIIINLSDVETWELEILPIAFERIHVVKRHRVIRVGGAPLPTKPPPLRRMCFTICGKKGNVDY